MGVRRALFLAPLEHCAIHREGLLMILHERSSGKQLFDPSAQFGFQDLTVYAV